MLDLSGRAPKRPPVKIDRLAVDGAKTTPLDHFWSRTVGSSHGAFWNRADWAKHLNMAREMGGFEYVRGHGAMTSTSVDPPIFARARPPTPSAQRAVAWSSSASRCLRLHADWW